MKLDPIELVLSLRSTICPACGGKKKSAQTFCYADYRKLSADMRAALYDRLGHGYEEAVEAALDRLCVEVLVLPEIDRNNSGMIDTETGEDLSFDGIANSVAKHLKGGA